MDRYLLHQRERDIPSFSSTLLDAIYRSIDESNGDKGEEELIFCRETVRKKLSNGFRDETRTGLRKACMVERWMEEKVFNEKVVLRKKSMADVEGNKRMDSRANPVLMNSSSSSSESSCGGGFSSSESDSIYGLNSRSSSINFTMRRPKPIRTGVSARSVDETGIYHHSHHTVESSNKHGGNSGKKFKQPISPGGRLASFLNSLFTSGNGKKKKKKIYSGYEQETWKLKSKQTSSTCSSSASSFSRSCLSKNPSSSGRNGTKRSVNFYPVSVVVDEDSRACGHKNLYVLDKEKTTCLIPTRKPDKECRRAEEAARELLKNYQKKQEGDQEEEEDDVESFTSSDLFELENLSTIGIGRYGEELPVYETTQLETNRAIANGLIL